MTTELSQLADCFEGVIPAVISTVSGEGIPNISYLSHVVRVDDQRIALSNQFFGKTSANLKAVPHAAVVVVDGRSGNQFLLDVTYLRSETSGAIFARVAGHLKASSAQVGLSDVMHLRAVDIFQVLSVTQVPSQPRWERDATLTHPIEMGAAARIGAAVSDAEDLGEIIDTLLDGLMRELGCHAACLLLRDPERPVLTTLGSRGYGRSGIGSEVAFGDGVIGTCADSAQPVKVSDLSRVKRLGSAVQGGLHYEQITRSIGLPWLEGAMSQLAVPVQFRRRLVGCVLVESRQRMAFGPDAETVVDVVARLVGALIGQRDAAHRVAMPMDAPFAPTTSPTPTIRVEHHMFDDSVFIENAYVIKGLAGRLLMLILERNLSEGRVDFSNRELRLSEGMRLPDFKDNLETRLLLLRRRLDEKQAPVRLLHVGRGKLRLDVQGRPAIRHV